MANSRRNVSDGWLRIPVGGVPGNPSAFTSIREAIRDLAEDVQRINVSTTATSASAQTNVTNIVNAASPTSGTVTSVGLNLPGIFTVSGSPVTTVGTLSATLATQTSGTVFAGPTGSLTATKGPGYIISYITVTGSPAVGNYTLSITNDNIAFGITLRDANNNIIGTPYYAGGAAPIDYTAGGLYFYFTYDPFSAAPQSQGLTVSVTTSTGTPTFRALTSEDIPSLATTKITTGTFSVVRGGTGLSTIAAFTLPYASATDTFTTLSPNTTTTRKFLRMVGDGTNGAAPAWDTLTAGDIPSLSGTYLPLVGGTLTGQLIVNTTATGVQYPINVTTTIAGSAAVNVTNTSADASANVRFILNNDANNNAGFQLRSSTHATEPNDAVLYSGSGSINLYTGGNPRVKITSGGQVRIGPRSDSFASASSALEISAADGTATSTILRAFGITQPSYSTWTANGTFASPSATQTDNTIMAISGRGYGATGFAAGSRVIIYGRAAENWTDAAQGTYLSFFTTATGTVTPLEKMRLSADGKLGLNVTAPVAKLHASDASTVLASSLYPGVDQIVVNNDGSGTNPSAIRLVSSNSNGLAEGTSSVMVFLGTRGTNAVPVATAAGDYLGRVIAQGFTGTARYTSASIQILQESAVTSGRVPAYLAFFTASTTQDQTERMRITSTGNVGIGNTSPNAPLAIGTDIGTVSGISIGGTADRDIRIGQSATNRFILAWRYNATATSAYALLETQSGNNAIVMQSNGGNVGIGVFPSSRLDVRETSTNAATEQLLMTGVLTMNPASNSVGPSSSITGRIIIDGGASNFTARQSAALFSASHIGTGTLTQVDGVTIAAFSKSTAGTIGSLAAIRTESPSVSTGTVTTAFGLRLSANKVAGVTTGYGIYQTGATDLNYFEGNVGIGLTSPAQKLDVGGAIAISGTTVIDSTRKVTATQYAGLVINNNTASDQWYKIGTCTGDGATVTIVVNTKASYNNGNEACIHTAVFKSGNADNLFGGFQWSLTPSTSATSSTFRWLRTGVKTYDIYFIAGNYSLGDLFIYDGNGFTQGFATTTNPTGTTELQKLFKTFDPVNFQGGVTTTSISGTTITGTSYTVSGTTVIDSSRNLTNIGTIGSGAITSSGAPAALTLKGPASPGTSVFLQLFRSDAGSRDGYIGYSISTNLDITNEVATGGNIVLSAGPSSNANVRFNAAALTMGATQFIDSSRNLTNIGTISSGAITSTANGGFFDLVGTDHAYIEFYPRGTAAGRKTYIGFATASTTNLSIVNEDTGTLTLQTTNNNINLTTGTGNVLIGVSNNANGGVLQLKSGITFPATAVSSTDANTLDDYEEGTFTPSLVFSTGTPTVGYAARVGRYTIVGNQVFMYVYIGLNAFSGGTAAATVTISIGTPTSTITSNSTANTQPSGVVQWSGASAITGLTNISASILPGTSTLTLYKTTTAATTSKTAITQAELLTASSVIEVTLTYYL